MEQSSYLGIHGEGVNAPCRMIRRDHMKYIYTHQHPDLLYNLNDDPLELYNLANEPNYQNILSRLKSELLDDWDAEAVYKACIGSQKQRLFIQKATNGEPNWAFQAKKGDEFRYIRNDSAVERKAKSRYPYVVPTPFLK